VHRWMTITGVDVWSVVGGFEQFARPRNWWPIWVCIRKVDSPGIKRAIHGHLTKSGRAQTRGMLVEAA
jgi:hypothetical protein